MFHDKTIRKILFFFVAIYITSVTNLFQDDKSTKIFLLLIGIKFVNLIQINIYIWDATVFYQNHNSSQQDSRLFNVS